MKSRFLDMSPTDLQDFLDDLKETDKKLYNKIIDRYFDDVRDEEDFVIKSWNINCDEVWDAEAFLEDYYNNQIK